MRPPRQRKPRGTQPEPSAAPPSTDLVAEVETLGYPEPVPAAVQTPYVLAYTGDLHVAGSQCDPAPESTALTVDELRHAVRNDVMRCPECEPAPVWWLTFRGSAVT